MIQFNLLPDVKLEYIKAQRSRRMVLSISLIVTGVAVALIVLLIGKSELQKKHLSDLSGDINKESVQLQSQPQINKVLTVQNQLESLTALHAAKPAAARLFDYLNQVTPAAVTISNFSVDMTQQTIVISGNADALSTVNQYVDTLKFTTYKIGQDGKATPAFSNVVLSGFGLSSQADQQAGTASAPANYTLNLTYDKNLFDITQDIKLTVPSVVTTRSELTQATDLFQASSSTTPATTTKGKN